MREAIKVLKISKGFSLKYVAAQTGIKYGTLLNWSQGCFDFGAEKNRILSKFITEMKGSVNNEY